MERKIRSVYVHLKTQNPWTVSEKAKWILGHCKVRECRVHASMLGDIGKARLKFSESTRVKIPPTIKPYSHVLVSRETQSLHREIGDRFFPQQAQFSVTFEKDNDPI